MAAGVLENTVFCRREVSGDYQMRMQCSRKYCKAFTLVEMLLVVFLISLLAGLAGLGYAGTYKKMQVEKAAKHLALTVKYARILAVEQQKKYIIKLDENTNSFFMLEEENQSQPISDLYSKPVSFSENVVFEQIRIEPLGTEEPLGEEYGKTISFQPDGTAQTAIIQLGNGDSHMTVGIDAATGRAKVYYGKAEEVKVRTIDLDDQWN